MRGQLGYDSINLFTDSEINREGMAIQKGLKNQLEIENELQDRINQIK